MYDWIVAALGLSTTQLNSTRLSGSGAGPFGLCDKWTINVAVTHAERTIRFVVLVPGSMGFVHRSICSWVTYLCLLLSMSQSLPR